VVSRTQADEQQALLRQLNDALDRLEKRVEALERSTA
jgi:chaperonin cofactor prefoldin